MNIITKINEMLHKRPKLKQWAWFIALWVGGFLTLTFISFLIKTIIYIGI